MRLVSLIVLPLVFVTAAVAQGDGGLPGVFLNDGVGARSIAMGKAFVGLANDGQATYYNPAGLSQLYSNELALMGATLQGGAIQTFASYVMPTQNFGAFGFSYTGAYIRIPADELRDGLNRPLPNPYSFSQNGFLISYSKDILRQLNIGLNYKVVYSPLSFTQTNIGHGFDVGLLLFPRSMFTLGLVAKNLLQPKLAYGTESDDPFPRTIRAGAALKLMDNNLTLVSDLAYTMAQDSAAKATSHILFYEGVEYRPIHEVAARLGLNANDFTFGLGFTREAKMMTMRLDYAILLNYHSSFALATTHKVSLGFDFGGFRTWVEARPAVFSPQEKICWLYLHIGTKRQIERWQLLIKNSLGETVRAYGSFEEPPLTLSWDGRDDYGAIVPDDRYSYELVLIEAPKTSLKYTGTLVRVKSKL